MSDAGDDTIDDAAPFVGGRDRATVFYVVYRRYGTSSARRLAIRFGMPFRNVECIIDIEQAMGLYVEEWIHNTFLVGLVHRLLERLLRHVPLRRDHRRNGAAVRPPSRALHLHAVDPGSYHRVALVGFALPTDAAPTARHCALSSAQRTASTTPTPSSIPAACGPSSPAPWKPSATTPQCRVCTSLGRSGAPWRFTRCCAGVGPGTDRGLPGRDDVRDRRHGEPLRVDAVGGVIALGVGLKVAPHLTRLLPGPSGTRVMLLSLSAGLTTCGRSSGVDDLADQIRELIIDASTTTVVISINLVPSSSIALHRVFRSPHDLILWDTGHRRTCTRSSRAGHATSPTCARAAAFPVTRTAASLSTTGSRTPTHQPF